MESRVKEAGTGRKIQEDMVNTVRSKGRKGRGREGKGAPGSHSSRDREWGRDGLYKVPARGDMAEEMLCRCSLVFGAQRPGLQTYFRE